MAKKGMSDREIANYIESITTQSHGELGSELSSERKKALDYYFGEKYGNEPAIGSKVITREVFETVERMKAQILKPFLSSEKIVEFTPNSPEDEQQAVQESEYCNYVFFKENNGTLILNNFLTDALLLKNGVLKIWWEEKEEEETSVYESLGEEEFMLLLNDSNYEVTEHTERRESFTRDNITVVEPVHDVTVKTTKNISKPTIDVVPPEDFYVSADSRTLDMQAQSFINHKSIKTASDLLEMGYPKSQIEKIPTYQETNDDEEDLGREQFETERVNIGGLDPSQRTLLVEDVYARLDINEDGYADLWHIVKSGSEILEKEKIEKIPFVGFTPYPIPHRYYGLSVADITEDIQLIKSTLMRQILDNLYLQNNSRIVVNELTVNFDDLLQNRIGGIIRNRGDIGNSIIPLQQPQLGNAPYQMLEKLDQMLEDRTGIGRSTTSLDPNVLKNNKGDKTVDLLMTASKERIALITRLFGETAMVPLFDLLRYLLRRFQDKERTVKLSGGWATVNPSDWKDRTNTTINVGLGTGEENKKMSGLLKIIEGQKEMFANGGLNIITDMKKIYNAWVDLSKILDVKNPDKYFLDPESLESQQAQQQRAQAAQKPDINSQMIQLQARIAQQQIQLERAQTEIESRSNQIDALQKERELNKDEAESVMRYQLEYQKLAAQIQKQQQDFEAKLTELELKFKENVPGAVV